METARAFENYFERMRAPPVLFVDVRIARMLRFDRKRMVSWSVVIAIAGWLILAPPLLSAQAPQEITGDWQGTLAFSPSLVFRLVLRITRGSDGTLSALNYSIDQGPTPMHTEAVTLQGRTFRFKISSLQGSYEGEWSGDGNAIHGTWTQGRLLPLNFARATTETAWEIPLPAAPSKPMSADADPSFDVATLKPVDPGNTTPKYFRIVGRRYMAHNVSLADLIEISYSVHPRQIVEAPAWVATERYDLVGVPDGEGDPSVKQWIGMLQKLLASRAGLVFHHGQRELSVYALTVDKGGPRNLGKSESESSFASLEFHPGVSGLVLPARHTTLTQFCSMMQMIVLDRPVADQTGLTGRFDFDLTFTPDDSQFQGHPPQPTSATSAVEPAPGLFQALPEQLGLRLTPTKAAMDVLVIDKVARPPAN